MGNSLVLKDKQGFSKTFIPLVVLIIGLLITVKSSSEYGRPMFFLVLVLAPLALLLFSYILLFVGKNTETEDDGLKTATAAVFIFFSFVIMLVSLIGQDLNILTNIFATASLFLSVTTMFFILKYGNILLIRFLNLATMFLILSAMLAEYFLK